MTARSFAFTKLVVADLESSEHFYSQAFGMKRVRRVTADSHKYALEESILSLTGEATAHGLILARYLTRPCPPAGSAWTGFVVADIEATLAAVARAGGEVEVPVHRNVDHGVLAAIVADPDGHLLEIIQILSNC